MKKLLNLILLTVVTTSVFTSCTTQSSSTDSEASSSTSSNSTETEAETETETSSDVLRVGMDLKFPPFSDMDENGNPIGFEPQVAMAFGEYLGMEVEIVDIDFSMLIPALEVGTLDILIADMGKTEERALKVDFSDPYRYSYKLALVNKEFAEENNITDDMPAEEFFALEDNDFIGLAGTMGVYLPQSYGEPVTEVTEIGTGIMEVKTGSAKSLVASNEIHAFHAANKDETIVYSGIKDYSESNFAVALGNAELLEQANAFIKTMYEEGGVYEQMAPEFDVIIGEFLQNEELGLEYIIYPPK